MAFVANFFSGIVKAIPLLLVKIGTFLLLIFTVGMFAGYVMATLHLSPLLLAIPVIAMFVMWYRLDEGILLLVLLLLAVLLFPQLVEETLGYVGAIF